MGRFFQREKDNEIKEVEIENKYQTSIYPIWLEENNNKITAYVDNNLLNDVSLDNENNNRNITTIKSVKH